MTIDEAIDTIERAKKYVGTHPDTQIGPDAESPYKERGEELWETIAGLNELLNEIEDLAVAKDRLNNIFERS